MKYTISELRHLMDIHALDYEDYEDSQMVNDRGDFIRITKGFLDWLEKSEKEGLVKFMLLNQSAKDQ